MYHMVHTREVTPARAERDCGGADGTLGAARSLHVLAIGVGAWFAAAMTVHLAAPFRVFQGFAALLTFGLTVPVSKFVVLWFGRAARLDAHRSLPAMALAVIVATWCDAIAMTWFRPLYSADPATALSGAAWILWGVGWFLFFSFRRSSSCPRAAGLSGQHHV